MIDGVIEFLSGETKPIRRELERRMREAAAERALRGGGAVPEPALLDPAPRRTAGRGQRGVGTWTWSGSPSTGDRGGGAGLPAPRRQDGRPLRVPPGERRGQDVTPSSRRSAGVLRRGAGCRRSSSCRRGGRPRARWPSPLRAARLPRRGARAKRGEKRRLAELAEENARHRARRGRGVSDEARCAASKRSRSCARRSTWSALPLRIECFDISTRQGAVDVGSMVVFEDALAKKAHYRKFGVAASRGRTTSQRWRRSSPALRAARDGARADLRRELRGEVPNLVVVDGGKGQLSAALAAMQRVRPAARRGDRAREARARRCSSRAAPTRSASTAHSPASVPPANSRRAHRFALGFHRQRRTARLRVDLRRAEGVGRRAGGRCCATSARPSGSSPRRRGARGRPRRARRRPRARSTRSCTRPGEARSSGVAAAPLPCARDHARTCARACDPLARTDCAAGHARAGAARLERGTGRAKRSRRVRRCEAGGGRARTRRRSLEGDPARERAGEAGQPAAQGPPAPPARFGSRRRSRRRSGS